MFPLQPIRELDREQARKERREAKDRARHEARRERLQYQEQLLSKELGVADVDDSDDDQETIIDEPKILYPPRDKFKVKVICTMLGILSLFAYIIHFELWSTQYRIVLTNAYPFFLSQASSSSGRTCEYFTIISSMLSIVLQISYVQLWSEIAVRFIPSITRHNKKKPLAKGLNIFVIGNLVNRPSEFLFERGHMALASFMYRFGLLVYFNVW